MPPLDTIEDSTADTERPVFQIARRWLQSKNRHERSISSHLRVVPNSYHHVVRPWPILGRYPVPLQRAK